jgi:uncharacterized protein
VIISDATAIIVLINIDRLDLLLRFKTPIIITDEVYTEVTKQPRAKKSVDEHVVGGNFHIDNPKNIELKQDLSISLDSGEASSIALAIENKLPLVIDEKKGRKIATSYGVKVIGVIGIIKHLLSNGTLLETECRDLLYELNSVGFYISDELAEYIFKE